MSMQESEQEWETGPEQKDYQADYEGRYDIGQQKIHPYERHKQGGIAFKVVAVVLSAVGFFPSVAGIVASAIVLQYAHGEGMLQGQRAILVGGVLGLVSSLLMMLVCIAIFVIAVVTLARSIALSKGSGGSSPWKRILRWQ